MNIKRVIELSRSMPYSLALRRAYQEGPSLPALLADEQDAHIMRRLLRVRRDNQRARAYPEQPGALV